MLSSPTQFDGDEWQDFVVTLLGLKYGEDLFEVPDEHGGDGGIEAYTSSGLAFQCYAPEGNLLPADIAKKHKDKIYDDTCKFCSRVKELSSLFADTKIRRWILIVPHHCSKEVVKYCHTRAATFAN